MTPQNTKTCNYCGHNFWALDKCPKCRDRFAMAALAGIIGQANPLDVNDFPKRFARWSYGVADAMMEARDK